MTGSFSEDTSHSPAGSQGKKSGGRRKSKSDLAFWSFVGDSSKEPDQAASGHNRSLSSGTGAKFFNPVGRRSSNQIKDRLSGLLRKSGSLRGHPPNLEDTNAFASSKIPGNRPGKSSAPTTPLLTEAVVHISPRSSWDGSQLHSPHASVFTHHPAHPSDPTQRNFKQLLQDYLQLQEHYKNTQLSKGLLDQSVRTLNKDLAQATAAEQGAEERADTLANQLKVANAAYADMDAKVTTLRGELLQAQQQAQTLRRERSEWKEKADQAEAETAQVYETLLASQEREQNAVNETQQLQCQLESLAAESEQVNKLNAQIAELQETLSDRETQLHSKESDVARLTADQTTLTETLRDLTDRLADASTARPLPAPSDAPGPDDPGRASNATDITADPSFIDSLKVTYEDAVRRLEADQDLLRATVTDLTDRIKEYKHSQSEWDQERQQYCAQLTAAKDRHQALEIALEATASEAAKVNARLTELQEEHAAVVQALQNQANELQPLQAANQPLSAEGLAQSSDTEEQIALLRDSCDELETEVTRLTQHVETLRRDADQHALQRQQWVNKIGELERDLTKAYESHEDTLMKAADMRAQCETLQEQVASQAEVNRALEIKVVDLQLAAEQTEASQHMLERRELLKPTPLTDTLEHTAVGALLDPKLETAAQDTTDAAVYHSSTALLGMHVEHEKSDQAAPSTRQELGQLDIQLEADAAHLLVLRQEKQALAIRLRDILLENKALRYEIEYQQSQRTQQSYDLQASSLLLDVEPNAATNPTVPPGVAIATQTSMDLLVRDMPERPDSAYAPSQTDSVRSSSYFYTDQAVQTEMTAFDVVEGGPREGIDLMPTPSAMLDSYLGSGMTSGHDVSGDGQALLGLPASPVLSPRCDGRQSPALSEASRSDRAFSTVISMADEMMGERTNLLAQLREMDQERAYLSQQLAISQETERHARQELERLRQTQSPSHPSSPSMTTPTSFPNADVEPLSQWTIERAELQRKCKQALQDQRAAEAQVDALQSQLAQLAADVDRLTLENSTVRRRSAQLCTMESGIPRLVRSPSHKVTRDDGSRPGSPKLRSRAQSTSHRLSTSGVRSGFRSRANSAASALGIPRARDSAAGRLDGSTQPLSGCNTPEPILGERSITIQRLESEALQHQGTIQDLTDQLAVAKAQLMALTDQTAAATRTSTHAMELQDLIAQLQDKVAQLQLQLQTDHSRWTTEKHEALMGKQQRIDELMTDLSRRDDQITSLRQSIMDLKSTIATLQEDGARLAQERSQLLSDASSSAEPSTQSALQLQQLQEQLAAYESQLVAHRDELDLLEHRHEMELTQYRCKVESLEREVEDLRDKIQIQEDTVHHLRTQLTNMEAERDRLAANSYSHDNQTNHSFPASPRLSAFSPTHSEPANSSTARAGSHAPQMLPEPYGRLLARRSTDVASLLIDSDPCFATASPPSRTGSSRYPGRSSRRQSISSDVYGATGRMGRAIGAIERSPSAQTTPSRPSALVSRLPRPSSTAGGRAMDPGLMSPPDVRHDITDLMTQLEVKDLELQKTKLFHQEQAAVLVQAQSRVAYLERTLQSAESCIERQRLDLDHKGTVIRDLDAMVTRLHAVGSNSAEDDQLLEEETISELIARMNGVVQDTTTLCHQMEPALSSRSTSDTLTNTSMQQLMQALQRGDHRDALDQVLLHQQTLHSTLEACQSLLQHLEGAVNGRQLDIGISSGPVDGLAASLRSLGAVLAQYQSIMNLVPLLRDAGSHTPTNFQPAPDTPTPVVQPLMDLWSEVRSLISDLTTYGSVTITCPEPDIQEVPYLIVFLKARVSAIRLGLVSSDLLTRQTSERQAFPSRDPTSDPSSQNEFHRQEIAQLTKDRQDAQQQVAALRTKCKQWADRYHQLERDLKAEQRRRSGLQEDVDHAQDALNRAQAQLDQKKAQLDQMEQHTDQLEHEYNQLQAQVDELTARPTPDQTQHASEVEVLAARNRRLRRELDNARREYETKVEDLENQVTVLRDQMALAKTSSPTIINQDMMNRMVRLEKEKHTKEIKRYRDQHRSELLQERTRANHQARKLEHDIQYGKALLQREQSFRADLGYQKQYLMMLIGGWEQVQQATLVLITNMGLYAQRPAARRKPSAVKFRKTIVVVLYIQRMAILARKHRTVVKQHIKNQQRLTLPPLASGSAASDGNGAPSQPPRPGTFSPLDVRTGRLQLGNNSPRVGSSTLLYPPGGRQTPR
ncbi:hypothetical protein H4R34_001969 [Dimargaris verticillata]|uniref:Pericentrin/AKAP-450 centrosomal targeting domain-containing protein n=1 Tax=Dimargaris verticillata TaxID=2761393 RepID=A0A9W8EAE7_9FUNG|nr:hypothetical protein H4R34_001969 [Dimargaris verticillata]